MTDMDGTGNAPSSPGLPCLLADENFNGDVVAGLRRAQPTIDVLTSAEAGTLGLEDPDVLIWAMKHDRILLSHDKRTMPTHFYALLATLAQDEHSPGVLLVPQRLAIGPSIDAVLEVWECSRHDEWQDQLIRLPL